MELEPRLAPSPEEQNAVTEILRRPQFAEAAKKLFPVEPPKPRPSLEEMQAEIARMSGKTKPAHVPPAACRTQPAPAESIRDRVIANHALPQAMPRGMESTE
jgi:acyl dehydratase